MNIKSNMSLNTRTTETNSPQTKLKESKSTDIQANNELSDRKNLSQLTDTEKQELSLSDKTVIDAIEKANEAISISNRRFEYSIHEKTKQIMIKVIDADSDEIIREIPPEKVLDMVGKMWEMAGIVVDEKR